MATRPTSDRVKEAIFNIIQFDIEGRRVLDLFAGSGQLAIEALSRGASYAVCVDYSEAAVAVVKENLKRTKVDRQAKVYRSDYFPFLDETRERFDIIFLDPPYAENFIENALRKISEIDILTEGGIIVCERSREKVLPAKVGDLYLFERLLLWQNRCESIYQVITMKIAIYPGTL